MRVVVSKLQAITCDAATELMNGAGKDGTLVPFDWTGTAREIADRLAGQGFVAKWVKLREDDPLFESDQDHWELVLIGTNGVEIYRSGHLGSFNHEKYPFKDQRLLGSDPMTKKDSFNVEPGHILLKSCHRFDGKQTVC